MPSEQWRVNKKGREVKSGNSNNKKKSKGSLKQFRHLLNKQVRCVVLFACACACACACAFAVCVCVCFVLLCVEWEGRHWFWLPGCMGPKEKKQPWASCCLGIIVCFPFAFALLSSIHPESITHSCSLTCLPLVDL